MSRHLNKDQLPSFQDFCKRHGWEVQESADDALLMTRANTDRQIKFTADGDALVPATGAARRQLWLWQRHPSSRLQRAGISRTTPRDLHQLRRAERISRSANRLAASADSTTE